MFKIIAKMKHIALGRFVISETSEQDLQVLWSECPGPICWEQT